MRLPPLPLVLMLLPLCIWAFISLGSNDNLVAEIFTPALTDDLKYAHEGHFKDPLVQLAYAQLWESLSSKRAEFVKTTLSNEVIAELASSFISSIKMLVRIHIVQWKYLSALMHLFTIKASATTQGVLRADGPDVLEQSITEGAADLVLLKQLLTMILLFAQDFRFLSAVTRDDAVLPKVGINRWLTNKIWGKYLSHLIAKLDQNPAWYINTPRCSAKLQKSYFFSPVIHILYHRLFPRVWASIPTNLKFKP